MPPCRVDTDARIAFVLRYVEGLELTETAEVCSCSLATIKRRLARAEARIRAIARKDPVLRSLLADEEGGS